MLPIVHLIPILFLALSVNSFHIPYHPVLVRPPSRQNASNASTPLPLIPWPPTPFDFPVSEKFPFVSMVIYEYGGLGPSVDYASPILNTMARRIGSTGSAYDLVKNHTESAPGVSVVFTATGKGFGLTRLQASHLFTRLEQLTRVHGAIGVKAGEIESYGTYTETFELTWMFESRKGGSTLE